MTSLDLKCSMPWRFNEDKHHSKVFLTPPCLLARGVLIEKPEGLNMISTDYDKSTAFHYSRATDANEIEPIDVPTVKPETGCDQDRHKNLGLFAGLL